MVVRRTGGSILKGEAGSARLEDLLPPLDLAGWRRARALVAQVHLSDAVLDYVERVVARVRKEGGFCSTRAIAHWLALAKAEAWLAGRAFITPDDLQDTFGDALAHRGALNDRRLNRDDRREQLGRAIREVPVGWKP